MNIDVVEVGEDALESWVAVHNATRPRDPTAPAELIDWRRQAESMTWFLASIDGVAAGVGLGVIGWHAEPGVARSEFAVLTEWRGHGLGTELLERLSSWMLTGGQTHVDVPVDEDDERSLAWAARRGFTEVGRNSLLALDLATTTRPYVDPPDGIEIVTWAERPDTVRGMYEVACEAYADVPGEEEAEMASFDEWRSNDLDGASDRAEATFVALAENEVVGYAKLSLSEAREDTAFHDMTGVKRVWRRHGIAGALKRAEIAWAIDAGYTRLVTFNEVRNEPIRTLNERHGYIAEPGSIRVRRALSGDS